jgi:hypothetical protein
VRVVHAGGVVVHRVLWAGSLPGRLPLRVKSASDRSNDREPPPVDRQPWRNASPHLIGPLHAIKAKIPSYTDWRASLRPVQRTVGRVVIWRGSRHESSGPHIIPSPTPEPYIFRGIRLDRRRLDVDGSLLRDSFPRLDDPPMRQIMIRCHAIPFARPGTGRRAEAEQLIKNRGRRTSFSFENACSILGLDPNEVPGHLLRRRGR